MDVNSKFILTSKIVERSIDEVILALDHLKELNRRFDLRNFITIYNRDYVSLELMLNTEEIGSILNSIKKKIHLSITENISMLMMK